MADKDAPGAQDFLPDSGSLASLEKAAASCRGCWLFRAATQTVFGEGRNSADIMLVGEQPGDAEDLAGRPFVGPAGKLLDRALAAAGLRRGEVYITNAVKHFNFEPRGKFRLHKRPPAAAIRACAPWLEAELAAVKPRVLMLLGATAAQAVLGAQFRVTRDGGKIIRGGVAAAVIATAHPSAILRAPDEAAHKKMFAQLVKDLRLAARELR
jgi:uracil-DNA glycosylase family protein